MCTQCQKEKCLIPLTVIPIINHEPTAGEGEGISPAPAYLQALHVHPNSHRSPLPTRPPGVMCLPACPSPWSQHRIRDNLGQALLQTGSPPGPGKAGHTHQHTWRKECQAHSHWILPNSGTPEACFTGPSLPTGLAPLSRGPAQCHHSVLAAPRRASLVGNQRL